MTDDLLVEREGPIAFLTFNRPGARLLDTAEAQTIGLIDRVHPAPELESRTRELAASLAELAPLTPRDLDDLILSCYLSRDFHEGVRAFLEEA